ncbi:hypothetical protein DPEC_G00115440 [Dallia pectoralis]|uniref:Uncharacterized protein n=1 Tax=Dallia pectoralis TaxID=75939 RepID=A0ACC2GUM1_DALPE|nr:hypothetical protein DPEC_G00115440 [Dallia pectoralis]
MFWMSACYTEDLQNLAEDEDFQVELWICEVAPISSPPTLGSWGRWGTGRLGMHDPCMGQRCLPSSTHPPPC